MQPAQSDELRIDPDQWVAYQRRAFGELIGEHRWRIDALYRSQRAEAGRIADKLRLCCRNPVVITIDDGAKYYIAESRCRSRVCPRCSRIRARTLATRIAQLIRRMDDPRFLTLTVRSNDRPLAEQVKHLRRRFAAMRRTGSWGDHVTQGVYTIEVTWNESTGQWHPHLHAIIDGSFWEQSQILELWERLVGDHSGVDIRAVRGVRKLANYLACYVSKSCDLDRLPAEQLAEWAVETHGLRMAQTFGGLHACKPQTDDVEPMPVRMVAIDLNEVAYAAKLGVGLAESILQELEPHRGPKPEQDPARIAGLISSFNNPFPDPPPKPRGRNPNQRWLLN